MSNEWDELTARLRHLRSVLEKCQDQWALRLVDRALEMSNQEREQFFISNELWGGAGSIADQAGVNLDRSARREIEQALIDVGEVQIRQGLWNPRTVSWVDIFKKWQRDGI